MEKDEIQERERQDRQDFYNTYRNPLARFRAKHPQALAEWLSTFVYIFMGITGSLSILTSNSENGGYATQCSAWGLAVMTAIYVGGGVSGAHLNPWISVSLWFYRGFPKRMCLTFIVAQMLGGFCAGALAYLIYREAILNMDPGLDPNTTGKAFFTAPQPFVSPTTAFFNDYVSMCIWIIVVFALGDDQNAPPGAGLNALIIGLFTYLLSISMGYQTGLGVNPARDLGPRLVALWAGYGTEIFTTGWWAYGPIGAGLAGSLTGGFIYDAFVFVGGESPVNYRWPHPTEVKWFAKVKKDQAKDKLSDSLV